MAAELPQGTLITVAPTGAELAKTDHPNLPTTLTELVATAKACAAARAGMIHVHLRDGQDRSCLDVGRLKEAVAAIRAETDLLVQLSTGGGVTDSFEKRMAVLDAEPDSCSLTCGTVNFGDDVFTNPWPFIAELYQRTQARGVVPEFELFDLGHVSTLHRLLDAYGPPATGRIHADLVMGVPGGMPGTVETVVAVVTALPADATFSATGIGRAALPVAFAALAAGGHLRVGLEDTVTFARGRPARDNAELVERAAALADLAGRPPIQGADARRFLGLRAG
ncbi:3-keto-5-aminohexanoate cleavage protein [Sporichthya sp.]|uniref:3-keto-5-aminohexanoate cleavage protein n=1 Tax=Sporichthya sp. TaxID=65475 RepID=UPI00182BBFBE|nr:3-keto-5-aminohexanoate cleavage protein [Sporichthya sp.]MBA3743814.1 3-keto-5-aminohexanoate cleavage protein [Sporichthya sp.]